MYIVDLIDEDFINYKKPSMLIGFPKCDFKCDKEAGCNICQNSKLATIDPVEVSYKELIDRYLSNTITEAVVFQGLEPFDSFSDLSQFIHFFSRKTSDDIVIYTGYNKDEIEDKIEELCKDLRSITIDKEYDILDNNESKINRLIVKFGRYIPNQKPHYDDILGVDLASDNQYAEIII